MKHHMIGYGTRYTSVPTMPDGRLARTVVTAKRVVFEHQEGHVSPPLMRDLEEFSRHLSMSGMYVLDLAKLGVLPASDSYIERVPDHLMCQLCTFGLRRGTVAGRPFWEFRVRASMMSAEIASELNGVVFPGFFGAVVPIQRPPAREPEACDFGLVAA